VTAVESSAATTGPSSIWATIFKPLTLLLGLIAKLLGPVLRPLGRLIAMKYFKPCFIAVIMFVGLFGVPKLGSYWVANFTSMAVYASLAASAGMLYGRVGLVSLGQVAPYGIGVWTTIRLAFATTLPFPVLVLLGGLTAMVIGVVIGLPALRVSGLYLAIVTLMLAASVEIVIAELKFANGGNGLRGVAKNLGAIKPTRRPSFALGDLAYYRFVVIGAFLIFMLAAFVLSRKPGRAWASIRQSEAAAISAGIHVTRYKMLAFALASFMAGIAGGLFAGVIPKGMNTDQFTRQSAIFLIAAVIMGGIHSLWGALLGGFFATIMLKFLTQNVVGHGFWTRFSLSLFGFGLIMNLVQGTKAAEKKGIAP
jgi:branched-chain amino acid transport system permease protein